MTGKELLNLLSRMPEKDIDLEVITEGCDCWGDVKEVVIHEDGLEQERFIFLRRGDSPVQEVDMFCGYAKTHAPHWWWLTKWNGKRRVMTRVYCSGVNSE